jgi:transposase-like protein
VPRTYDAEFRRRVVELVLAGRPVRVVAVELGLAEATVYQWKAQDLVDHGSRQESQRASEMSWLRQGDGSGNWRLSWPGQTGRGAV